MTMEELARKLMFKIDMTEPFITEVMSCKMMKNSSYIKNDFQVNVVGKVLAIQNKLKFGIVSSDLTAKNNSLFELIYEGMLLGQRIIRHGSKLFKKLSSGRARNR